MTATDVDGPAAPPRQRFGGILGIDLGTTYSCVAVMLNGRVDVIPNDQGNRTTPSRVAFLPNGRVLVGDATAAFRSDVTGGVLVYDAKRMIGRKFDDAEMQRDRATWPFVIRKAASGGIDIEIRSKEDAALTGTPATVSPEQVSAVVLGYLKECAERHLGQSVSMAVITVPAYFNDAQREHTRLAGVLAGLDVVRVVNEPTAAALAYGLDKRRSLAPTSAGQDEEERMVLVFDFGGGTFDVSVVLVCGQTFKVESTNGHTHLGGQDIDNLIVNYCLAEIKRGASKLDLSGNAKAVSKLRFHAEKAKRALSFSTECVIEIDGLLDGGNYYQPLSRAKLDSLCVKVFNDVMDIVKQAVAAAKISPSAITDVVMVGGSSRIPRIHHLMREFFGGKSLDCSLHPDEAIAIGAAIQASVLSSLPAQKSSATEDLVLMDVVPLSIGIDINDGTMDVLIPRNSTIPRSVVKDYTTVENRQRVVSIDVYEGERPLVKHNRKLGGFDITGITSAAKGVPTIKVTLKIDANGILNVTGEEIVESAKGHRGGGNATSQKKELTVKTADRYSASDIENMITQAQQLATADRRAAKAFHTRHELRVRVDEWLESHPSLQESNDSYDRRADKTRRKLEKVADFLVNDSATVNLVVDEHSAAKLGSKLHKLEKKCEKLISRLKGKKKDKGGAETGDDAGHKRTRSGDGDGSDNGGNSDGSADDDDGGGSESDADEEDAELESSDESDSDRHRKKRRAAKKKQ